MLRLQNFSIVLKKEAEQRSDGASKRPLRERVGTILIRTGERIGGRNLRAEAAEEIRDLALFDIKLSRQKPSSFEGPLC